MLDGPASDYALGDTRQAILQHLRGVESATPKQIAMALSLNYETVKKTCRRMADAGQLDTDGQGTYFPLVSGVPPVPGVPDEPGDGTPGTRGTVRTRSPLSSPCSTTTRRTPHDADPLAD